MPISITWDSVQGDTVIWTFEESFTTDEFFDALYEVRQQAQERQLASYYVVTDVSQTRHFPRGLIASLRSAHRITKDQYRFSVVVGSPIFVQNFVQILHSLSIGRGQYYFADSLDEALAVVQEKREFAA